MARGVLWTVTMTVAVMVALMVTCVGASSERYGLPPRYITLRREQRAAPLVVDATAEGARAEGAVPGHTRAKRSLNTDVGTPIVNVVSLGDSHKSPINSPPGFS